MRRLVEDHLAAGAPVGSKALSAAFEWGPSTIRHELANLEELGLLAHPHTSAGRIPTDAGHRYVELAGGAGALLAKARGSRDIDLSTPHPEDER